VADQAVLLGPLGGGLKRGTVAPANASSFSALPLTRSVINTLMNLTLSAMHGPSMRVLAGSVNQIIPAE
jgi:hypothetical protein